MPRESQQSSSRLSRRTALAGAGAAAAGVGLGQVDHALAQETTPDALASHPLVGTWAVMTTGGVVPQTHGADGSVIAAFPPNYVDPVLGLTFQGPALGRWESTGARSGRFTFLQALSDAAGAYVGTFQLEADIEASEDGQTWSGTTTAHAIVRDAGNAVIFDEVLSFDPPVTAARIGATIESVVLPVATPDGRHPDAVARDAGTTERAASGIHPAAALSVARGHAAVAVRRSTTPEAVPFALSGSPPDRGTRSLLTGQEVSPGPRRPLREHWPALLSLS